MANNERQKSNKERRDCEDSGRNESGSARRRQCYYGGVLVQTANGTFVWTNATKRTAKGCERVAESLVGR